MQEAKFFVSGRFDKSIRKKAKKAALAGIILLGLAVLLAAACGYGKSGLGTGREGRPFSGAARPACPELIRIHVIANSDAEADQKLKCRVRDAVLEILTPEIARAGSAEESRQILRKKLPEVKERAQQTVREAGFPYAVRAEWGMFSFPARFYGEIAFPAGNYEAVRIVIGEGQGANWWCVLYPPLCFIGPVAAPATAPAPKSGNGDGGGDKTAGQGGPGEKRQGGASEGKTAAQGGESLWPAMAGAAPEGAEPFAAPPLQLRSKLWEWCKSWRW